MIKTTTEKGRLLMSQSFTHHLYYITKDNRNICIKEYNKKAKYKILGKWIKR